MRLLLVGSKRVGVYYSLLVLGLLLLPRLLLPRLLLPLLLLVLLVLVLLVLLLLPRLLLLLLPQLLLPLLLLLLLLLWLPVGVPLHLAWGHKARVQAPPAAALPQLLLEPGHLCHGLLRLRPCGSVPVKQ